MPEQTAANDVATVISFLSVGLFFSFISIGTVYVIIKSLSFYYYRLKLKRVDLNEYVPFGYNSAGLPRVFQSKKNPQKLIFV